MKDWIEACADGAYWIVNAQIVDPVADRVTEGALRVEAGRIAELVEGDPGSTDAMPVLDARGLHLAPGLIDMHVHLREPGFEHKETVASGAKAAASGGVTTIACMPNTQPVCDNGSVVRFIREQAARTGLCRVLPVGAITQGSASKQLADMGEMLAAGAVAFSDDGLPVTDAGLLRHAMEQSLGYDALLISHAEELALSKGGAMHEGEVSTRLGLKGIPREAEDIATDRDIRLAAMTGGRLHIAHVSSRNSVEIIRQAKAAGARVTAETAPHYLLLDHTALASYDTHKKMNPPIREREDQEALIEGLLDGTLDCIATDHAPHTEIDKDVEFAFAPNGVVGLETSLSAVITRLVDTELMSLPKAIALLSSEPAAILGLDGGRLEPGRPADLLLFDPEESWQVTGQALASKSKNTPFEGMILRGRARATFLGGRPVFVRDGGEEHWSPNPWSEASAVV
jgi:dihydroorotase